MKLSNIMRRGRWAAFAVLLATTTHAFSAEITMGIRNEPSIDPHFMYTSNNVGFTKHMYEHLVEIDNAGKVVPGLAESWETVEPTKWLFHIRKGIKFHDGSDLDAEDVVASLNRIPNVPNNPGTYAGTLKTITSIKAVDPHTIEIETDVTNPYLLAQLAHATVIPKEMAEGKDTADFTSGAAAVGTGPYKFVSYTPGDRVILERNPDYWGNQPEWDKVTFRIIPADPARVAALIAGDIDVADFIPPVEVDSLKEREGITIHTGNSNRLIFLSPNTGMEQTDQLRGADGSPLAENPLRDVRVREALSLSIDRNVLVERVMSNLARETNQIVPFGYIGWKEDVPKAEFDPEKAKNLLAEAGFADGMGIQLNCTNDRYVNDARICQALGQMLSRGGFKPEIVTQPASVFFSKSKPPVSEFALALRGWGSLGEMDALWYLLHSYDPDKRLGTWNLEGWKDPVLDEMIVTAMQELDDEKRGDLEHEAGAYAVSQFAMIPLYYQSVVSASKDTLDYTTNIEEQTIAMNARSKK